ncbi:hypothetical protein AVEN_221961-1 [Araneus ventricosus]|uniref:Uncharacterized protein n=1 Tax=Araneus ventricosus TaxID=182803 RepID=A0A4Y2F5W6_ARAVE|nr:hypothetical protein AVEN_221961-1 [Araneus ventricosus]
MEFICENFSDLKQQSQRVEAVLKEYEDLSHMNEVTDEESQVAYYMPHRGVYRPEKATTKLRTVFNASSPTTKGKSLNSIQCNGGMVKE